MELLYDARDDAYHERIGSQILYWLDDVGARPMEEVPLDVDGFLFAGARPIEDYRRLVADRRGVRDRPDEREPLLRLDTVLDLLDRAECRIPTARTWTLSLDAPFPSDLTFPLFVRTAASSWKKGGQISRVRTPTELEEESAALRRALGWDATILAREWLDLAPAGEGRYGPVPQEVRCWAIDGNPVAWSFHYMHVVRTPNGLPLSNEDRPLIRSMCSDIASAFRSRLVVADFARGRDGKWWFIEAGPGSCAGTDHEAVFKAVARQLRGDRVELTGDRVGGPL
jgi:hypothetical protein